MNTTKIGQTGGYGGQNVSEYVIPSDTQISEIHVRAGDFIDALQIIYKAGDTVQMLPYMGGEGGEQVVVALNDDEYVTGLSGRSGTFIDSLTIHTNKRTFDPIGGAGGEHEFAFMADGDSEVVGFYGRQGDFIDALGIVARQRLCQTQTPKKKAVKKSKPKSASKPKSKKTSKKDAPLKLLVIKGIGPKTNRLLISHGIVELSDLANTDLEQLRGILTNAGVGFRRYDPSTWQEQAQSLLAK